MEIQKELEARREYHESCTVNGRKLALKLHISGFENWKFRNLD